MTKDVPLITIKTLTAKTARQITRVPGGTMDGRRGELLNDLAGTHPRATLLGWAPLGAVAGDGDSDIPLWLISSPEGLEWIVAPEDHRRAAAFSLPIVPQLFIG